MYNDVWRRTQVLEGLVKDSMSLSNATRRELQDGIRTVAVQIGRRGLLQSDRDRQEGNRQWFHYKGKPVLNEMGHKENLSLMENFTVPRIQNSSTV
jgi:hypothetical protein